MFDHYRPRPDLQCPVCGASARDWQGKDGPCQLYLWKQGKAAPMDEAVDPNRKAPEETLAKERLPERFEIYGQCMCPTDLEAVGFTEGGVWTRTELLSPSNAVPYPHENERGYRKRLAALAKHPGHPK